MTSTIYRGTQPSMIRRIAAGLAGIGTLIVTTILTLGTVLAAPIGVLAARALARRGNRELTLGAAWLGAVIASFLALMIGVAGWMAMAPPETRDLMRAVIDSAQAQEAKPTETPAWLQRINPQTTQQNAAVDKLAKSRGFITFFGAVGLVMACSMLGTLSGSIGWLASLLLGYAITGRWVRGQRAPAPVTLDE